LIYPCFTPNPSFGKRDLNFEASGENAILGEPNNQLDFYFSTQKLWSTKERELEWRRKRKRWGSQSYVRNK